MKPRNTLLLLLVLAALGAYVYWVEWPQEERQAAEKKLVTLDRDAVTALTLDYPDRSITLEKKDGRWRLVKPVEADADETVVKNLLGTLADAEVTRTLEDVADKLASYGLDTPEATARITLADGTALPPLKVGKTTSVGFSSYVQKGDDPKVYITGAAFQSGMKKQVKDLRDKTVITFEDQEVQKIELARAGGPVVLERQEGDRWQITAPASYPADGAEIRALLASIRGIRADDFVSDDASADLAPYGLTTPRLEVRVWLAKDRAQKTLLVGGTREEEQKKTIYAKRAEGPSVYTIPEYSLKNLDKDLATLRDKTVLAFEKEKAARIEVTRKDGAGFTLAKREGTWHIDTPGEGVERVPTMTRFLDDVAGMKGSEIVAEHGPDLAKFGLDAPDLTIAVSDEGGKSLGTMIAARSTATGTDALSHLAAAGGDVVYGVKSYSYDRIDKRAADFREKPATPVPTGAGIATPAAGGDAGLEEENLGADGEDLGDGGEDFGDEGEDE